jgi:RHH-type transcriptional regulator, proline utilization regulon repressor / proline dehydrogenase / delta 1-pyrroline-5-carboxylate dehydrogenase
MTQTQLAISATAFADEKAVMQALLGACPRYEALRAGIYAEAEKLVSKIRREGSGHGVEAFLSEYGLDTQEGVAIMCLAEALLRIPDEHTADELIRDKFEGKNWDGHLGGSDSLFVNASSFGLMLTGRLVELGSLQQEKPSGVVKRLVGRLTEPVVREALKQAVKYIGTQFVMGTDIEEAMQRARSAEKKGYRLSYDILGEGARTMQQAEDYIAAYRHAIAVIGKAASGERKASISIKLSALHPRYQLTQADRVMGELLPNLKALVLQAKQAGVMVSIDAEESYRLDLHMMLFKALREDPDFNGYDGLGFVLQAYGKRAYAVVDWLLQLSKQTGHKIPVRLVKGAYWDTEIKLAQLSGLPGYPVFTRKAHTDVSYLACAEKMLANAGHFFPQFATHNALTLAAVRALAKDAGVAVGDYEFQRLHGMGEKLYDQIIGEAPCRIYAPVGRHEQLLAYLIRRLLENGANSSFVNQLMDESLSIETLLEDPLEKTRAREGEPHPSIPLPEAIYGSRRNSRGVDFGNSYQLSVVSRQKEFSVQSSEFSKSSQHKVTSPIDGSVIGSISFMTAEEAGAAAERARAAYPGWNKTPVAERTAILRRIGDLLEQQAESLHALTVREAGKTWPDAVAEIREAVDFCRYYAEQAETLMQPQVLTGPTGESNTLHLHGRGVFLCISPWNFPLAIFTGQVVAALVTGNCVLAKPAEQTPLIAQAAVALMHQAGVPKEVLQLIPGKGSVVGEALVKHPAVAGVCFTGSVPTAQRINRAIAARDGAIIPLIAETGGQNAMVVDSTALLEQACDDIILSAFGSAGQRCSALRVLFVQEDVAEELLALVKGAMTELRVGDPSDPATDVGPVIDAAARDKLLAHVEEMKRVGKLVAVAKRSKPSPQPSPRGRGSSFGATPLPEGEGNGASAAPSAAVSQVGEGDALLLNNGTYVLPHAFEIPSIDVLKEEHFGPILHVVRFKAEELEGLAEKIAATGYGLTFGLHSRIEDHWGWAAEQLPVGNIYINRSMIGATVGVQPFGGEGLSGTGPKAGGPYYLQRFVLEKTVTINTAAIGGNLELLK